LFAVIAVGVIIALIGLVTFFSTRLVDAVVDQFESQELAYQFALPATETYFSLIAEITNLAAQPEINTASSTGCAMKRWRCWPIWRSTSRIIAASRYLPVAVSLVTSGQVVGHPAAQTLPYALGRCSSSKPGLARTSR
jgi:hypothetical protein